MESVSNHSITDYKYNYVIRFDHILSSSLLGLFRCVCFFMLDVLFGLGFWFVF